MKKELATLSFLFGPGNRFALHVPMTKEETVQSLQNFAKALMATDKELSQVEQKQPVSTAEQLTFNWGEPICGNSDKIPA